MRDVADISVIMPVYNAQDTLARCLDSLLAQTMPPKEIILIDDGSTDSTKQIIDAYQRANPGVFTCLHQNNAGPSAARNTGLNNAHASYITFVDSDDKIDEAMYEKMFKSARANDSDLVVCGRTNLNAHTGKPLKTWVPDWQIANGPLAEQPQLVRKAGNIMCDKLFRRSIIEAHHIRQNTTIRHAEDFLFISEFKLYSTRASAVQEPLYYYYVNSETSLSGSNSHITDIAEACLKVIQLYSAHDVFKKTQPYLEFVLIGLYLRRCRACEPDDAKFIEFKAKFNALFKAFFNSTWASSLKSRAGNFAKGKKLEKMLDAALSPSFVSYSIRNYTFKKPLWHNAAVALERRKQKKKKQQS